jgi:hypothetical protein
MEQHPQQGGRRNIHMGRNSHVSKVQRQTDAFGGCKVLRKFVVLRLELNR